MQLGKYATIVILSTLAEPKTLVEISTLWFNNKGRLYQPANMKEIKDAVKKKWLVHDGKHYRANMEKLLISILKDITLGENNKLIEQYKKGLQHFYIEIGDYTQKVYLNIEIIKALTNLDHRKVGDLDLTLLIQLPFFLRYLEKKDDALVNIIIQVLKFEPYVETIENLEIQYYPILKKQRGIDDWVEYFTILSGLMFQLQKKELIVFSKNIKAMKTLGK
jgi:hypothetical protein